MTEIKSEFHMTKFIYKVIKNVITLKGIWFIHINIINIKYAKYE